MCLRKQNVTLIIRPLQNRFFRTDGLPERKERLLRDSLNFIYLLFSGLGVQSEREEALLVRKGYLMKPFVAFLSVSKAPLAVVS